MTYSGSTTANGVRESLGQALAALQEDPNIPQEVMAVASNIAQAVGALFEAERASSELDGKSSVRSALGSLSQTLALLQDVRAGHPGIQIASEVIARSMSSLYPLTTFPSKAPPAPRVSAPPSVPSVPAGRLPSKVPDRAPTPPPPPPRTSVPAAAAQGPYRSDPRQAVEANIGATTESNFFVGFSGEISEGGVFLATYETLSRGAAVDVLVTLPGGFQTRVLGRVRFVRDPMDFGADVEPGMGIAFEGLSAEGRELILRFIRKRAPMFYDE